MIPIPNTALLEHYENCVGQLTTYPAAAALRGAAEHSPVTGDRVRIMDPAKRAPAAPSTSRLPGPLVAVERDGPGTDETAPWRVGSVPAGKAPGEDEPDVAARLAEPPPLLHFLTWLRYHARRRP